MKLGFHMIIYIYVIHALNGASRQDHDPDGLVFDLSTLYWNTTSSELATNRGCRRGC